MNTDIVKANALLKLVKTKYIQDKVNGVVSVNLTNPKVKYAKTNIVTNTENKTRDEHFVPSESEAEVYKTFEYDYKIGFNNKNTPYEVLGYRTPSQAQDMFFKMYLALSYTSRQCFTDNKMEYSRKMVANKAKTYIAHNSSKILYGSPKTKTNDVNKKMIDYALQNAMDATVKEEKYEDALRQLVTASVYSPTAFIYKGYEYNYIHSGENKMLDWNTSGHTHQNVDAKEMMIANPKETDIQKQPFIIRERYIAYNDAIDIYGKHKNFSYVKQGYSQKTTYDFTNNQFNLELNKDEEASFYLIKEVSIYYKFKNKQYTFLNGVLVNNVNVVNYAMNREDGQYPFEVKRNITVPGNFYGVCLVQEFEQEDRQASMMLTKLFKMVDLVISPPLLVIGQKTIDSRYLRAGGLLQTADKDMKITPIGTGADLNSAMGAIAKVDSMGQETQSDQLAGLPSAGAMTATESRNLQNYANVMTGEWINNMKVFTKKYSKLLIGDILEHDLSIKIDENSAEIINKDIINKGVFKDGQIKDIVVRPKNKDFNNKDLRKALKDNNSFEYESEINRLLQLSDEENDKEIILFDRAEIFSHMIDIEIDIEYLSNGDKSVKRAEFNEFLTIASPLGGLDPSKVTRVLAEEYLGDKASDILAEAPTPFDTQTLSAQTQSSKVLTANATPTA